MLEYFINISYPLSGKFESTDSSISIRHSLDFVMLPLHDENSPVSDSNSSGPEPKTDEHAVLEQLLSSESIA